jgi:hypothetical protein
MDHAALLQGMWHLTIALFLICMCLTAIAHAFLRSISPGPLSAVSAVEIQDLTQNLPQRLFSLTNSHLIWTTVPLSDISILNATRPPPEH